MSKNAWLKDSQKMRTEEEVDLALANISHAVDGANLQRQINCKKTLVKASKYIDLSSTWDDLDADMILRLLRLCSEFTTDDMQELIAKILAWEYNQPWKYSLKTLDVVRNLNKKDIELFQKFCWYVFDMKNFFSDWFILWSKDLEILRSIWVWYDEYLYLQDIWLVGNSRNISRNFGDEANNEIEYEYSFSIQNEDVLLYRKWATTITWLWTLTKAWEELLSVTWFIPNDILKDLIVQHFVKFGFKTKDSKVK